MLYTILIFLPKRGCTCHRESAVKVHLEWYIYERPFGPLSEVHRRHLTRGHSPIETTLPFNHAPTVDCLTVCWIGCRYGGFYHLKRERKRKRTFEEGEKMGFFGFGSMRGDLIERVKIHNRAGWRENVFSG